MKNSGSRLPGRSAETTLRKSRQSWLKYKLRYANEPRLWDRLGGLAQHAGSAFVALCDDPKSWTTVVTESRNRLTHHDKERAINFQSGDLYFLTESVFALVMLCLLRECRVSEETLAAIGASGSMRFLHGKLTEIIPRLHAQVARVDG